VALRPTASQTVGPYFHIGLFPEPLANPDDPRAIRVGGVVTDGEGQPVGDALIEAWLPDEGLFGRTPTGDDGGYELVAVKPAPVGGQAPHIAVSVFARGLLTRLVTRIYFPDEEEANAGDPVLAAAGEARDSLIAQPEGDRLRFDIRLQGAGDAGEGETAFLDV
jgi:protocatechuate 3,4-dioxygenase alpha subunit